jgi:XRE family transcriptional regulator, regulator of sulfur utilization
MDLGNAIKQARKQRGLPQKAFAELCGITPGYLSLIESNQKEPNLSTLKTIGEKLNIPVPFLFFMALDSNDIKPDKKEAFDVLKPAINSMVSKFFTENNDRAGW